VRHDRIGGEVLDRAPAAGGAVDGADLSHGFAAFLDRFDQEALDARPHDLGQRPGRTGDHRRAAGQRLGEDDAERLVPPDRHDHRLGASQQPALLQVVHRTDMFHATVADLRHDLLPPVVALRSGVGVVAGDDEALSGAARDLDRPVCALDMLDAAQEDERRVGRHSGAELQVLGVGEVVDREPLAAARPAGARDILAAAGEGQHAGRRELRRELDRARRGIALERHHHGYRTAQMR
jgi:hypothetical protein